jgi:hypothetical protein
MGPIFQGSIPFKMGRMVSHETSVLNHVKLFNRVWSRSLPGIADSNPAMSVDVCVL